MNDIVVRDRDGATWRYHAVHGTDRLAAETGWVLVIEGGPREFPPQALTAGEVLGDLWAMGATSPAPHLAVRSFTARMLAALEARATERERDGLPAGDERARVEELRVELATLDAREA